MVLSAALWGAEAVPHKAYLVNLAELQCISVN